MKRSSIYQIVQSKAFEFENIFTEYPDAVPNPNRNKSDCMYTREDMISAFLIGGMYTYDHYAKVAFSKQACDNLFCKGGLIEFLDIAKKGRKFRNQKEELLWTYKWLADHWHDMQEE